MGNQKHDRVKACTVCGTEFTPAPTKRARALTCSERCRRIQISRSQRKLTDQEILEVGLEPASVSTSYLARRYGVDRKTIRKYRTPLLAEHLIRAVL